MESHPFINPEFCRTILADFFKDFSVQSTGILFHFNDVYFPAAYAGRLAGIYHTVQGYGILLYLSVSCNYLIPETREKETRYLYGTTGNVSSRMHFGKVIEQRGDFR